MPTNPKDNKGGDLAEIRDLAGRQPKGTVTRRKLFAEQKTGTLEKFRAQQTRKEVDKTRLVNHSRARFQEKAQTPPPWAKEGPGGRDYAQEDAAARIAAREGKSMPNMPAAAESRMKANKPLKTALIREVEPGRNRQRSANQLKTLRHYIDKTKHFQSDRSAMAAAETGEAQAFVGKLKPGLEERTKFHNTADLGRVDADFARSVNEISSRDPELGEIKNPGSLLRTQQHKLQSREFNRPPAAPGKDLGRSTLNVIKRESELKGTGVMSGSLMTLAKQRSAKGQSIAGRRGNLDGSRNSLSNYLRGKGKGGPATGSAPRLNAVMDDLHDLTMPPGSSRKLRPGDL